MLLVDIKQAINTAAMLNLKEKESAFWIYLIVTWSISYSFICFREVVIIHYLWVEIFVPSLGVSIFCAHQKIHNTGHALYW